MLPLGHTHIGNYIVWITTPYGGLPHYDPKAADSSYFLVYVTRTEKHGSDKDAFNISYYVNLIKSDLFKFIFNVDKNYRPIEGVCDMVQYNHYIDNKEQGMPLWKLSKASVLALLDKCKELSNSN